MLDSSHSTAVLNGVQCDIIGSGYGVAVRRKGRGLVCSYEHGSMSHSENLSAV